jgi:hypothetical protein
MKLKFNMILQYNQGCYIVDWLGRPHIFVRCIACLHCNEDCRHLRNIRSLMLIHADETQSHKIVDKKA